MLIIICLLIILSNLDGALACGMGGIGGGTSFALLALVTVFSPVIAPIAGAGYLIQKGNRKLKESKQERNRKRNSDIIKTQMSRATKKIGKDKFLQHLQELANTAKETKSTQALFDIGIALFLSRDFFQALGYLDEAIKLNNSGDRCIAHAYYIRGLNHQYMHSFQAAVEDFQKAVTFFEKLGVEEPTGADVENHIPKLGVADALNSFGFAHALCALYPTDIDDYSFAHTKNIPTQLNMAIESYTTALASVEVKQGMWYHNRGVARYFRTYHVENATQEYINSELELALADFNSAINSNNFGTAADGYAMAAQTMARLFKPKAEIDAYIEQAYAADPKVFMVDVNNQNELSCPWPLPTYDYPLKNSRHNWTKKQFHSPTWCYHCKHLVVGVDGFECSRCKKRIHSKCCIQAKSKDCWNESVEEALVEGAISHTHRFQATHFSRPTWCGHCKKFIKSPIGKQGYSCSSCEFKVHKECASATNGFIDE